MLKLYFFTFITILQLSFLETVAVDSWVGTAVYIGEIV